MVENGGGGWHPLCVVQLFGIVESVLNRLAPTACGTPAAWRRLESRGPIQIATGAVGLESAGTHCLWSSCSLALEARGSIQILTGAVLGLEAAGTWHREKAACGAAEDLDLESRGPIQVIIRA